MAKVIGAFLGDEKTARRLVTGSQARLLLICPDTEEMGVYAKAAPNGLAARLVRGDVPDWLTPLRPDLARPYRVYAIRQANRRGDQAGVKSIAAPFMQ